MQNNRLEQAFDHFLNTKDYDQAESALFAIIRNAYLAGYQAAQEHWSAHTS